MENQQVLEVNEPRGSCSVLGTYTRDSFTGLDYADQRFYASTYGRFNTADPYRASAGADDPGSWNRYAYVQGDPVNYLDPHGLFGCKPEVCQSDPPIGGGGEPGPPRPCNQLTGVAMNFCGPGGEGGAAERPIDTQTDVSARATLSGRLKNFGGTNCDKVFGNAIKGYSTSGLLKGVGSTEFYDARAGAFGGTSQDQVVANGADTTLANSLNFGQAAATIHGSLGAAVLLGANFFSNTNAVYQGNVLLHELLHAVSNADDNDLFGTFGKYGLRHQIGGTEDISAWLSTDCKSTPTNETWWNK